MRIGSTPCSAGWQGRSAISRWPDQLLGPLLKRSSFWHARLRVTDSGSFDVNVPAISRRQWLTTAMVPGAMSFHLHLARVWRGMSSWACCMTLMIPIAAKMVSVIGYGRPGGRHLGFEALMASKVRIVSTWPTAVRFSCPESSIHPVL